MLRDRYRGCVPNHQLRCANYRDDIRILCGRGLRCCIDPGSQRRARQVICWAGDGGTYDIGLGTLSAAAERNENIIYICYDNEIYGNTGGQRSSATLWVPEHQPHRGARLRARKTSCRSWLPTEFRMPQHYRLLTREDFARKMSTALSLKGMRFLLLHSPCPTGWKSEPEDSVKLIRLAVASGLFPLYEVFDGSTYRVNIEPDGTDPAEYFHRQRRFKDEELDLVETRRACSDRMQRLKALRSNTQRTDNIEFSEPRSVFLDPGGSSVKVSSQRVRWIGVMR